MANYRKRRKKNKIKLQEKQSYHLTKLFKRELMLTAISVILVLIAAIGGSYAVFSSIEKADDYNIVRTGLFQIEYDDKGEGLGNIINLNGAYPESDSDGEQRDPYKFKITNTGTISANYRIRIVDDDEMIEEDGCRTKLLPKEFIRYKIDDDIAILSTKENDNYQIAQGILAAGESRTYELRMWIGENAGNEVLGTHFHGKIEVDSQNEEYIGLIGKIFEQERLGEKGKLNTTDNETIFISGEDPNNYVMYSSKLWRVVSQDQSDHSVKLVTQDNQKEMAYQESDGTAFLDSAVKTWLNDSSENGFLKTLKFYENFLKINSQWNATMMTTTDKPEKVAVVEGTVGLLNVYEYSQTVDENGASYLNNGTLWWTLTPYSDSNVWQVGSDGVTNNDAHSIVFIRPTINLKSTVEIAYGKGTKEEPYYLRGDIDTKS